MLTQAGLYEQQDEKQVEHNLRGVFTTDAEGRYSYYCIKPTPYPVRPVRIIHLEQLLIRLGAE